MKRLLALLLLTLVLLPGALQAPMDSVDMKADALSKDPTIRVRVSESDHQVGFTVALRRWGKNASDCPYASLRLLDPEGGGVGRFGILGGDIHRVLHEDVLRAWGWEDFKPAEAFRFTVSSNLLAHSTFEWEYGPPYPNDEHGFPRTGTLIFRSHLKDLVEAARNANEEGPWKGSQPNR
jgi:hypothetical protein